MRRGCAPAARDKAARAAPARATISMQARQRLRLDWASRASSWLSGGLQVCHHRAEETARLAAGYCTMIERQRERQHLVHDGRSVDRDDLIAYPACADYGHCRRNDNG